MLADSGTRALKSLSMAASAHRGRGTAEPEHPDEALVVQEACMDSGAMLGWPSFAGETPVSSIPRHGRRRVHALLRLGRIYWRGLRRSDSEQRVLIVRKNIGKD